MVTPRSKVSLRRITYFFRACGISDEGWLYGVGFRAEDIIVILMWVYISFDAQQSAGNSDMQSC
jgi:hypothetical protein